MEWIIAWIGVGLEMKLELALQLGGSWKDELRLRRQSTSLPVYVLYTTNQRKKHNTTKQTKQTNNFPFNIPPLICSAPVVVIIQSDDDVN